ncbi:hypothetical protein SUDANB120_05312 [Streptomyces sp. enrichment culture]|uniref:hypothetical protein n=1 Tax=Streptomyces TaxID=1883 RepID=UPI00199233D4|nr:MULTISPECIES: hypothetical protein [Streptomyces]GGS80385.1 hypothetical protein GCM10010286_01120 [Streptomyces toxytricini]
MTRQLLPAALENRRRDIPVVDSLPAKGFPGYVNGLRRMGTVHDVYGWTNVFAHINMSADEAYALTDKRSPHALYELMLMSAGTEPRPGLHDHSPEFGRALGVIAARFAEHCRAYQLSPVVSWSYDPHTVDRESIQGEKRFHAHLVGRTQAERADVAARAVRAGRLSPVRSRRIVEEASVLGALISADIVDGDALRVLEPVPALSTHTATATAQYRLPDGWESLASPDLHADLTYIHRKLRRTYDEITRVCTTGTAGMWRRPVVREFDPQDIDVPLRTATRATLAHYLRGLRPELLSEPVERSRKAYVYPLADLAYAVTIAEQDEGVFLHLRTNVFSDLGGAGISIMDGVIVKTKKGVGDMSPAETAGRAAFQSDFLRMLHRHPEAARALFPRL